MSPFSRRQRLLLLLAVLLVACSHTPPPEPVTAPVAAVAVAQQEAPPAPPAPPDETFVEDADPGPVPIHASDPWWGRLDAPVTIVEFADFQCPFSMRATTTLAELRLRYGPEKLRIVWKNLPLSFHQNAAPAALVAAKVFERSSNDGFWRVHDAFYGDQKDLSKLIADFGAQLGLSAADVDDLKEREKARLDAYAAEAKAVGATGTPAFFINGVHLSGAQPIDKFTAIIDAQLAKASALVERGTPRRRVYAELAKAQWQKPAPNGNGSPAKDDLTVWLVPIGKSPVRGKATALVTIVEFADFQCPFSARVHPTLQKVLAKYGDKVRLVYKHNPLPFHPNAEPAAELAMEARAEKGDAGFWKAYDRLFGGECRGQPTVLTKDDCEAAQGSWVVHQTSLDAQGLAAHAAALGLDAKRVAAAIASKKYKDQLLADQELADDVQGNGTPHFFINGRRLVGAQPFERFVSVIDEELAKAEALVKGGVKPADLYTRIMAAGKAAQPPERKTVPAPTAGNPSRGAANAKVVVQMFADFQCPFCKRALSTIEELEKAHPGLIRVVWRNLPLPMHKNAEESAEAAMEAFRQKGSKGFWAMHELLFAAQGQPGALERPALLGYAAQLGLDVKAFESALDQKAHKAVIDADAKLAADAGITGTPAFVINGYFVSGAQPVGKFEKVLKLVLAGK